MFEFDETFSDISSSSSTASFDFTELLDAEECQLLSRSLSLEALPPITDEFLPPFDDVPPFPPTRPSTLILPNDYPLKTPRYNTIILDSYDETRVTPTISGMTNGLKEPSESVVDTNAVYFICVFSAIEFSFRCRVIKL